MNGPSSPLPLDVQAFWLKGIVDALKLPAWVVGASLISVGALAQSSGYSVDVAMASTLLVWAGPAQVLFFSGVSAGMALPALAIIIALSSMRFFPMTMALIPLLPIKNKSPFTQFMIGHMVSVTVWAESLRRLPPMNESDRIAYYFGFGGCCIFMSTVSTGLGFVLSNALPMAFSAGLLFLTPVFFTCSISAGARNSADWLAIASGLFLEPVLTDWVGPEFDLLVIGLIGGSSAYLVKRQWVLRDKGLPR